MFVYMEVPGIEGVGPVPRPDWISLEQCTFGFERQETSTKKADEAAETTVRAVAKPLSISRAADRATPALAAWMALGDPREISIEFCLKPEISLVEFTVKGARLRSYSARFESYQNTTCVMERLSIEYEDIDLTYWQQSELNEDKEASSFELNHGE